MHCDGKCHLKESLKQASTGENEESGQEAYKEVQFSPVVFFKHFRLNTGLLDRKTFENNHSETERSGYPLFIDRPPSQTDLFRHF